MISLIHVIIQARLSPLPWLDPVLPSAEMSSLVPICLDSLVLVSKCVILFNIGIHVMRLLLITERDVITVLLPECCEDLASIK